MSSSQRADEVVSVRLPKGAMKELKAALNVPFSTFVRSVVMTVLDSKRQERQEQEAQRAREADRALIHQATEEELRKL